MRSLSCHHACLPYIKFLVSQEGMLHYDVTDASHEGQSTPQLLPRLVIPRLVKGNPVIAIDRQGCATLRKT